MLDQRGVAVQRWLGEAKLANGRGRVALDFNGRHASGPALGAGYYTLRLRAVPSVRVASDAGLTLAQRAARSFALAREEMIDQRLDVMVGAMPVSAQPILLLLTWTGVHLKHGSTADQGRTGRKDSSSRLWRPARALGTHAKQGPSTGHSAVGLRQGGETSPDAEATFHRASCTLGNQVVDASDGPPFRQECRPTRVCRKNRAGRHAQGEGDVAAERDPN